MALSRCWIDETALRDLLAEAARWRLRETGGALLGWRDGADVAIACVLGPGPDAKHRLRSFEPDGPWQVAQGRQIYAATNQMVAYLGDWHTHPFGRPTPSRQDETAARQIATDADFRASEPLSGIVGRAPRGHTRLVMHAWDGEALAPIEAIPCRLDPELVGRARASLA